MKLLPSPTVPVGLQASMALGTAAVRLGTGRGPHGPRPTHRKWLKNPELYMECPHLYNGIMYIYIWLIYAYGLSITYLVGCTSKSGCPLVSSNVASSKIAEPNGGL